LLLGMSIRPRLVAGMILPARRSGDRVGEMAKLWCGSCMVGSRLPSSRFARLTASSHAAPLEVAEVERFPDRPGEHEVLRSRMAEGELLCWTSRLRR
jgi:hypothetical protein